MNNILITGGQSFIAKSVIALLKKDYQDCTIFSPKRSELDICDFKLLYKFIIDNNVKIIIHTAVKGNGKVTDTVDVFYNNVQMIENLLKLEKLYDKLIVFSSGAEFDRRYNIFCLKDRINIPIDYYGFSKYVQTSLCRNNPKISNLRIFNVFGELENDDRFIKTNIKNYINKQSIIIKEDKFFDFFYIEDLYVLIKKCINSKNRYKEVNCVYKEKLTLSEVASLINLIDEYTIPIVINAHSKNNYCGRYSGGDNDFVGLINGIKKCFNFLKS